MPIVHRFLAIFPSIFLYLLRIQNTYNSRFLTARALFGILTPSPWKNELRGQVCDFNTYGVGEVGSSLRARERWSDITIQAISFDRSIRSYTQAEKACCSPTHDTL